MEYNKSVWAIPAESARKVGHPAPFPVELPRRLIQLYTFKDEVCWIRSWAAVRPRWQPLKVTGIT